METLIKMIAWLTDHSLHRHGEQAPSQAPEPASPGRLDPADLLGLGGLRYRAPWEALQ